MTEPLTIEQLEEIKKVSKSLLWKELCEALEDKGTPGLTGSRTMGWVMGTISEVLIKLWNDRPKPTDEKYFHICDCGKYDHVELLDDLDAWFEKWSHISLEELWNETQ